VFVSVVELTANQKGAIAEASIAAEATKLGLVVLRPNLDVRYRPEMASAPGYTSRPSTRLGL
jgi:hypothetical protein